MVRLGLSFLAFLTTLISVIAGVSIAWYACETLYPLIPQPYKGLVAVVAIIWAIVSVVKVFNTD